LQPRDADLPHRSPGGIMQGRSILPEILRLQG
jgi:hypothetical protein